MWWRYRRVTKIAGKLVSKGYIVFSPITHSHPIAVLSKVGQLDSDLWLEQDKFWLDKCDEMWIVNSNNKKLNYSYGVFRETDWATGWGKPIVVLKKNGEINEFLTKLDFKNRQIINLP